jgi:hypothetical protein
MFAVERFAAGLTVDAVEGAAARMAEPGQIVHLFSLFVPGDDAALSLFDAPTISALEAAASAEGSPVERVVPVVVLGGVALRARAEREGEGSK